MRAVFPLITIRTGTCDTGISCALIFEANEPIVSPGNRAPSAVENWFPSWNEGSTYRRYADTIDTACVAKKRLLKIELDLPATSSAGTDHAEIRGNHLGASERKRVQSVTSSPMASSATSVVSRSHIVSPIIPNDPRRETCGLKPGTDLTERTWLYRSGTFVLKPISVCTVQSAIGVVNVIMAFAPLCSIFAVPRDCEILFSTASRNDLVDFCGISFPFSRPSLMSVSFFDGPMRQNVPMKCSTLVRWWYLSKSSRSPSDKGSPQSSAASRCTPRLRRASAKRHCSSSGRVDMNSGIGRDALQRSFESSGNPLLNSPRNTSFAHW